MALTLHNESIDGTDLTRRERRKREVRDRIVDAAVTLFEKDGPQATRVDEICELADIAQKTFFNHFATKQHLVSEIATTFLDNLMRTLEEVRGDADSAGDRLRRFFALIAERCEEAGPMHRELVLDVIRVAHLQRAESTQARIVHDAFHSFLKDCSGELHPDYDVETHTELVVGTFYVLMLNWVSLDDYPLHERAAAMGNFLATSIASV